MMLPRGPVVRSPSSTGESSDGQQTVSGVSRRRDNEQIIRLNLLRALQLHRRLALTCALGGVLLAVAYVLLQWPIYTAKSQIYVQPVQPKVMSSGNDQNSSVNAAAYDAYIQQQVQSASSPAVLASALKKLGPGWQRNNETEQSAADRLGHAIEAVRVGTGYEIAITARASDPVLAAKIANAVAESIAEKASVEGNDGDAQRITVLRDERDRIQNELKQDYEEQDDLNKQLGMAAVGPVAPDLIDEQISKTRDELIKAQTDHDQASAKFSAMKAGQSDSSAALNAEADDLIAEDAGLSSMKTSLNQRRAVLITQMANLTPQNPGYKLAADELAKINASLDAMMKDLRSSAAARIQQKLSTDLERTARVEDQLNGQLRELARTAAGATPKLQRVNDLATDIVRLRNRFSTVDEQLHNLIVEDSAPGAVHVSVAAVPPLHPSYGKILKGALPLVLGGVLLGLLAAVIVNKLDPRIYIAADIEDALGFAPIAVLPDFEEVSDGVTAEYLLRLAVAIEHAGRKGNMRTCIFTGSSRHTGVTTIGERVKNTLCAMGRRAVLLDATGHARDESQVPDGSAGPLVQRDFSAELDVENIVLVDTPPLALSAETEYFARSVDGALVVVRSGVTTRAQLLAAVNTLQRLEVGAVGFVLNRVTLAKADPGFRHSLEDMEKHLRSQGNSSSMWPVSWHGFLDDPARKPESAVDDLSPEQAEPASDTAISRIPNTVVEFPKPTAEAPSLPKSALPNHAETSWWLLPNASPAPPAPTQACAVEPVKSEYPASAPPRIQPPKLPDWFWEGGPGGSGDFLRLSAPENAESSSEPLQSDAEARIERLRGLFANVGLAALHRNRGSVAQDEVLPREEQLPRTEQFPHEKQLPHTEQLPRPELKIAAQQDSPESPVAANQFETAVVQPAPVAISAANLPEPASAVLITAEPQILSPKESVTVKEPKRKPDNKSSADWDDDEIHTLPAKRGQYGSR